MIILKDDGTFSNIIASDTAAGTDPVVSGLFEAGHYIAVIANHLLMENDFNPFHTDVNLALSGYEYEFNGPDPEVGQINFNCKLSGNLDGTFSKKVYTGGSDTCSLPVVSVDEPGYLFLSGLIILSLMFQHKWRKN